MADIRLMEVLSQPDLQSSNACCAADKQATSYVYSANWRPDGVQIALVNVPYGIAGDSMKPLGLAALGAYLISNGIRAVGFDFSDSLSSPEELTTRFGLAQFPIVGLSFYNTNARLGFLMARAIKSANPATLVVAGGPHVSAASERFFHAHPEIDIVVKNEGESQLLDLISAITGRRSVKNIPGIMCHQRGETLVTQASERIDDLDSLPPPIFRFTKEQNGEKKLHFFDRTTRRVKSAIALVTSRSCPFRCSFCAIILIGRKWRRASPEKVIDDLIALESDSGEIYEHVYFLDANFFVDARRALEIAEALHRFRSTLTFSFSTRVNQLIRGKASLPELTRLGLRAVELGIESGSDAALRRFTKDTTVQQNADAIRLLSLNGIQLFLDFIMFDACATVEDISLNLAFLENNSLDAYVPWDHVFSHMTPYLGTAIRQQYSESLGMTFDEDELPAPGDLIRDATVRDIFREINKLRPNIAALSQALWKIESALSPPWSIDQARLKLNAAMVRRLPFVVLRNLVKQASLGHAICFEHALPTFFDDDGCPYSLEEFLDATLH